MEAGKLVRTRALRSAMTLWPAATSRQQKEQTLISHPVFLRKHIRFWLLAVDRVQLFQLLLLGGLRSAERDHFFVTRCAEFISALYLCL